MHKKTGIKLQSPVASSEIAPMWFSVKPVLNYSLKIEFMFLIQTGLLLSYQNTAVSLFLGVDTFLTLKIGADFHEYALLHIVKQTRLGSKADQTSHWITCSSCLF